MSIDNKEAKKNKNRKALLEITEVNKQFPGSHYLTLNDINLSIYEGEFFALLGPSGCGKTTLMRLIAGFDEPDNGSIKIDGIDVTNKPPYERPVNMMFQSYALFPNMNVEENIAFGLKQEKLASNIIKERIEEVLDIVKMSTFRSRNIQDLSGGQQQRIALARCLAKRPKILLLDEPLGALDLKSRERTQLELINIQNLLGVTFVMVTHNQQEAMAMANRMAIMDSGQILQVGSPQEIYDYPNSSFVADFIGSINMLDGEVVNFDDDKDETIIRLPEPLSVEVKVIHQNKFSIGTKVKLGIRPEELTISEDKINNEDNYLKGEIIDVGFLGDQVIYHAKLISGQVVTVTVPTAARSRNKNIVVGSNVYISWHDTDGIVLSE
ncbi:MAG: ABC transporter ATP-binding protein [Sphingobacteriia bacterium]|nr:ABC transporter ATP-binding protein [Sphingobacteriia bacterium]